MYLVRFIYLYIYVTLLTEYLVVNITFPFLPYNFILLKGEMDISKNRKVSLFNHYPSYHYDSSNKEMTLNSQLN